MTVWIVYGLFGSDEWIESVHATEEGAEAAVARLWVSRSSDRTPEHAKRVAKFDVEAWTVQP